MSNARPWSSLRTFARLTQLTRLHFTRLLALVAGPFRGRSDAQAQSTSFTRT
jgi:hypothetical protein